MQKLPAKLKVLKGTANPTKERRMGREMSMRPLQEIPQHPEVFDDERKEMWYRVCSALVGCGILAAVDLEMVRRFCEVSAWVRKCEEKINSSELAKPVQGGERISAWYKIWQDATKMQVMLAGQLGLSPIARSKITNIQLDNGAGEMF